ncbi:MAG TPA: DUF1800 domain-containing protein [Vicinamibacterales bacterium]|nr:DUF1800 domain-containing protein [Vicinamibacterales bacterium]
MNSTASRHRTRAAVVIPLCTLTLLVFSLVSSGRSTVAAGSSAVPAHVDDKTIVHVLNRLGFGAMPGDVDRVRRMGLEKYIDQQLRPETIPDQGMTARLTSLDTLTLNSRELAEDYFMPAQMAQRRARQNAAAQPTESATGKREARTPEHAQMMQAQRQVFADLAQQKILRAIYSERQLNEVLVDFWFNHFNVFAGKGLTRNYLTEYERDAIRPHVLGKFRDLLEATAKSPAMLFYLDNWQSAAPEGARIAAPNTGHRAIPSNPRRPFRRPGQIGTLPRQRTVADLPPNAQNRKPRGLNENYARELMELHTLGVDGGYTQKDVQEIARAFTGWTIANPRQGGGFVFDPRMHDDGEKIVLGHKIKASGGEHDGKEVLDILASHPSTARFIATKLARRFVADEPPPSLVDRAAQRFRDTKGDLREVVRTILTSREFFAPEAYRAKVKTPFEFVASAARATAADSLNAMPLVQAMRELGMPLYQCQPPTGYADRAEAWVNTGALLNRMNFAVALTEGRVRGARAAQPSRGQSVELARDEIVDEVLAGDLSSSTRETVAKASRPSQAVALLLGSPEFQRR